MLMRLNQAKDMSINVATDCLYSSMTFTATNEQEQRRPKRTPYRHSHTSMFICVCSVLSCFVSVFVRLHMDFVDGFMENLLDVLMLILSFIGLSKCNFCHTPSPSLASISPSTHLTFEIFLFLYNSCAPHIYLLHNDTFFSVFSNQIHMAKMLRTR